MSATAIETATPHGIELPIGGMTCSACAVRLEKALNGAAGITDASVNFALERARIAFDEDTTDVPSIARVISQAGFDVGEEEFSFEVGGLTCSACVGRVEKALLQMPGVVEATVNLALERADVRAIAGTVTTDSLSDAVTRAGYEAHFPQSAEDQARADEEYQAQEQAKLRRERNILLVSMALSAPMVGHMIAKFLGSDFVHQPFMEVLLATPIQFIIGARFYKAAWNALRARGCQHGCARRDGHNVRVYLQLVSAFATLGAMMRWVSCISKPPQSSLPWYCSANSWNHRAKRGTTAAIRQLMDLRPETARD